MNKDIRLTIRLTPEQYDSICARAERAQMLSYCSGVSRTVNRVSLFMRTSKKNRGLGLAHLCPVLPGARLRPTTSDEGSACPRRKPLRIIRFRLKPKAHSLHAFSSSDRTRFAGLRSDTFCPCPAKTLARRSEFLLPTVIRSAEKNCRTLDIYVLLCGSSGRSKM